MVSTPSAVSNFNRDTEYLIGSAFECFSLVANDKVQNIMHSLNSTNGKLDRFPSARLKKCPSTIYAVTEIINNLIMS